jgi:hypothetical protein
MWKKQNRTRYSDTITISNLTDVDEDKMDEDNADHRDGGWRQTG